MSRNAAGVRNLGYVAPNTAHSVGREAFDPSS